MNIFVKAALITAIIVCLIPLILVLIFLFTTQAVIIFLSIVVYLSVLAVLEDRYD
jgi:hypothetical protein